MEAPSRDTYLLIRIPSKAGEDHIDLLPPCLDTGGYLRLV